MRRRILIMMLGLLTITLVISACGAGGGPEKVVRDFIAAINAGNYEKARQYFSPDKRDDVWVEGNLETYRKCEVKVLSIREIIVRDSIWGRDVRYVTVILTRTWNPGSGCIIYGERGAEIEIDFEVEKLKGRWYISAWR